MIEGVWESLRLRPHIHMKGWGLMKELIGGVWFVKIEKVIIGWLVACMGDEVKDKSMVTHDETNEQWEVWGWWNVMNWET
jgi:hypothetical protein